MKRNLLFTKGVGLVVSFIALFLFNSCGGDDGGSSSGGGGETPSTLTLTVTQQSISEGSEVDASNVNVLIVTYSKVIAVSSSANITVNDKKVNATVSANNVMALNIPLTLTAGTSYTVKIPSGSVVYKSNTSVTASDFTLNFKTKAAKDPGGDLPDNEAVAMTRKLGWGWNLGNHFDTNGKAISEGWGYWDKATPSDALFQKLVSAGAKTVRIPATWTDHMNSENVIDAKYLDEVAGVVDKAIKAGLNVILNTHHDSFEQGLGSAVNNSATAKNYATIITAIWKQVAEKFVNHNEQLIFETFNEIHDGKWGWGGNLTDGGKQYALLNEWNQLVVNTIRATGGNNSTRWIGVPGYAANPTYALEQLTLPTDNANRILVSVHFYDPSNFTLSPYSEGGKTEWGHTATKGSYAEGSNEDHVKEIFGKLRTKFIENNIPCYIGEYGCTMHKTTRSNSFRSYYLEYVCRAAYTNGLPVCIWDNNVTGGGDECHGYFNHNDGTYLNNSETLVKTMIKATTSTDGTYTLETIYANAPK